MKVQLFQIEFDDAWYNRQSVYRSGDTIRFKVRLKLREPVKCRSVKVRFFGNSYVNYNGTPKETEVHYSPDREFDSHAEEVFIDETATVFAPPSIGPNANHHPAGEFVYPVHFILPQTAPSSFEGIIGIIRYSIKASIDRYWKEDDFVQKFFTVVRDLDLNSLSADLIGPFSMDETLDIVCCRFFDCFFGDIRVKLELPKRGYVPGEQVKVTGEIHNNSKEDVETLNLEIQQVCYILDNSSHKQMLRETSVVHLGALARGQFAQVNHRLPIGSLPGSFLEGCKNIDIRYFLRLNVISGAYLSVAKQLCEIVVGTLPLRRAVQPPLQTRTPSAPPAIQEPLPQQSLPQQPVVDRQPQAISSSIGFSDHPPSYEECIFGPVDTGIPASRKSFSSASQWAPSYPVYLETSAPPAPEDS